MDIIKNIDFGSLNGVDIAVLTVIGLSVLFAFLRGFIGSMMSLVGWIASIVLTYQFSPQVRSMLSSKISSEVMLMTVSYGSIMVISLVGFAIVNSLVSSVLGFLKGGFLDKMLGALFGLFRGILIVSFAFLCISFGSNLLTGNNIREARDTSIPDVVKEAETYELLVRGKNMLLSLLPGNFDSRIKDIADIIEDSTLDERFISNMIRKMYNGLSDEEIDGVESKARENSTQKSEEQVERQTASDLLDIYKKKQSGNKLGDDAVSDDDIKRLERILRSKSNK